MTAERTKAQEEVVAARDALVRVLRSRVDWRPGVRTTDADVTEAWATYEARVTDANCPTPLSSSPVARAEVTEEVIAREWDAAMADVAPRAGFANFAYLKGLLAAAEHVSAFARRIASLSSPDAAAVRREAAREALTMCAEWLSTFTGRRVNGECVIEYRDQMYPEPAPPAAPRSVRLACGDVIEEPLADGDLWRREHKGNGRDGFAYNTDPTKLLYPTDTIADLRAVESLASTLAGTK